MIFTGFQISTLITAFVAFFVGLSIYSRDRKSSLNLSWLFASLSIGGWSLGLFGVVFSKTQKSAWIWQHVLDISAILIPILFLNFILVLIKKEKKLQWLRIFSWVIGIPLLVLSFTSLFKTGVSPKFDLNFWIDAGRLYFLFPLAFIVFATISVVITLVGHYKAEDKVLKRQLKYVFLAQLFGFGGGITNFFPQLFQVYPFGNYLVILYVLFITYASLKHHLFDIKVIATELLTCAVWVFLLVKFALSETINDFILNGFLLTFIVIFGILLVRSVLKEVKQREEMEKMARRIKKALDVEKKATRELNKLGDVKNQFIMASQHHLRTPLTSMRGYLDLILTGSYGPISPKVREALGKFELSTKRLIKVVNEFLDITQFQMGKEVVTLKEGTDLKPIFQEVKEELGFEAKARGLGLDIKVAKNLPLIKADAEKLKIGMFNIVDNAIKYTKEGSVKVNVKKTDHKVTISVKDNGVGIPKDKQKDLFNRLFERGKDARRVHGTGKGIGLFITAHIIRAHKGKIWAESEGLGKGSTFFIDLPIK